MTRKRDLTPRLLVGAVFVLALIGLIATLSRVAQPAPGDPAVFDPIVAMERQAYDDFAAGRPDEALAGCNHLEAFDFVNPRAMYIRGLVYEQAKEYRQARYWYDLADRHGEKYAARRLTGLPRP